MNRDPMRALLFALLMAAACGGGDAASGKASGGAEHRLIKNRLEIVRNYIYADKDDIHLDDAIGMCEKLIELADGTPYQAEAEALRDEAANLKSDVAGRSLQRARKDIEGRLEERDYEGALAVLDNLDPAFAGNPLYKSLAGRRDEIRGALRFKLLAETILGYSGTLIEQGELEKADGLLDAYELFDGYAGTPWARGIAERRAELDAARQESGGSRAFWESIFDGGDLYGFKLLDPEAWNVDDGVMVGKNDLGRRTLAEVGDDGWIDYQIYFKFKIKRGRFELVVRGEKHGGDRRYFPVNVIFPGQDDGRWHTVRVTVRGTRAEWTRVDTGETRGAMLTNQRGPFGLVLPEDAEVRFKDVRVKVLDAEAVEEDDTPDDLEGWGEGDGLEGFDGEDGEEAEGDGDGDEDGDKDKGKGDGDDDWGEGWGEGWGDD